MSDRVELKRPDRSRWDDRKLDHVRPYLERAGREGRYEVVAIVAGQEYQWVFSGRNRQKKPEAGPNFEFFKEVLEITPSLIAQLRRAKLASAKAGERDFVFRLARRHRARSPQRRSHPRARDQARGARSGRARRLVYRHRSDLRRPWTLARTRTFLIAQGWDIAEVSARLGHASVATALRVYVSRFDAANRSDERRSRLASLYGSGSARGSDR